MKRLLIYLMVINTFLPVMVFYIIYHLPEWNYFLYADSTFLQFFWDKSLLLWIRLFTGPVNLAAFIAYLQIKENENEKTKKYRRIFLSILVVLGFTYYFWQIVLTILYLTKR